MSLDAAIAQLEEQLVKAGVGGPNAPKGGSTEYFVMLALGLAVAELRQMKRDKADNPDSAFRHYREGVRRLKIDKGDKAAGSSADAN